MQKTVKGIVILVIAIILEIGCFNIGNIVNYLFYEQHDDTQLLSCSAESNESGKKQYDYYISGNVRIFNIVLGVSNAQDIKCTLIADNGTSTSIKPVKLSHNRIGVRGLLGKSGLLRIEVEEGSSIESFIVNYKTLFFSISRVIGMLLIYIMGKYLFDIQKMPNYTSLNEK